MTRLHADKPTRRVLFPSLWVQGSYCSLISLNSRLLCRPERYAEFAVQKEQLIRAHAGAGPASRPTDTSRWPAPRLRTPEFGVSFFVKTPISAKVPRTYMSVLCRPETRELVQQYGTSNQAKETGRRYNQKGHNKKQCCKDIGYLSSAFLGAITAKTIKKHAKSICRKTQNMRAFLK